MKNVWEISLKKKLTLKIFLVYPVKLTKNILHCPSVKYMEMQHYIRMNQHYPENKNSKIFRK